MAGARGVQMIVVGLNSKRHEGAAAVVAGGRLAGVCAEERVTRERGNHPCGGWPDAAVALMLRRLGHEPAAVGRWVVAGDGSDGTTPPWLRGPVEVISSHLAHANTAYRTSPFASAVIVICDHSAPEVSVWLGEGADIRPVDWTWTGAGFATAYSAIADALGLGAVAPGQRLEALARLAPDEAKAAVPALLHMTPTGLHTTATGLHLSASAPAAIGEAAAADARAGRPIGVTAAAALLTQLGDHVVELLAEVRRTVGHPHLCLGGSLFRQSSMTTRAKRAGLFDEVFVPVDPGNGGLAVGAALHGLGGAPASASPFLGPAYAAEEIKEVLANCKLLYSWESDERGVQAAVEALMAGRMVGWFDGAMEWGPRALGARSILASPFSPYVLENLNRFLKHREPWRGYSLSGLAADVHAHFDGPDRAPYMECDYRPRDPQRFGHVLPAPGASLRLQTVVDDCPPRFRRLLEAFGEASGLPFLVNTSFNGFHEPIVCSPRDAVRVFYGSGVDVLVMPPFVLRK
jgi:carbamoyltransferase